MSTYTIHIIFQVIEQLAEILKSGNLPEVKQWVIMTNIFVKIIITMIIGVKLKSAENVTMF